MGTSRKTRCAARSSPFGGEVRRPAIPAAPPPPPFFCPVGVALRIVLGAARFGEVAAGAALSLRASRLGDAEAQGCFRQYGNMVAGGIRRLPSRTLVDSPCSPPDGPHPTLVGTPFGAVVCLASGFIRRVN